MKRVNFASSSQIDRLCGALSRFRVTGRGICLTTLAVLANCTSLPAQTASPPAQASQTPTSLKVTDLKVTAAQSWPQGSSTVGLGSSIDVTVANLSDYLAQNPSKQPSNFVLSLDSRPIAALDVRRVSATGADKDKLRFDLTSAHDDDAAKSSQEAWNKLLGSPPLRLGSLRTVGVTVGLDNQPIDSSATIKLTVIPRMWGSIGMAVVILVSVGLVTLVWNSDLLKDPGLVATADGKGTRRPYSLSRTQLAIWFWAIFSAYIFIWVINGETASLTGQVLGILGISSATLAGSTAMSARNTASQQAAIDDTSKKLVDLNDKLAKLDPASQEDARSQLRDQTDLLKKQFDALVKSPKDGSGVLPFFWDILSDEKGISLPRFQVCAWTLISVVIFLSTVWQKVSMPAFDEYMLTLMGLSSGTYVGMKATEKPLAPPSVASS